MNPFQKAELRLDQQTHATFGELVVLVINNMHHHIIAIFNTPDDLSRARAQSRANDHRIGQVQTSRSTYQLEILNDRIVGLPIVAGVLVHVDGAVYKIGSQPPKVGPNVTLFEMTATGEKL